MTKKQVTLEQLTDVLNQFLERAFMASGLAWVGSEARWSRSGGTVEPTIPKFEYFLDTRHSSNYEYIHGFHQDYNTAFGVGLTVRGDGSSAFSSRPPYTLDVSWGSGGCDHPEAKVLLFQMALNTKTLYESMADDYLKSIEILKPEKEVATE